MPTKKKDPKSSSSLFEEVRFPMQPFRSHGAPQCSVDKIDYLRKDDPDGKCRLVANGKVNIYQQIQSYRADTEYSVMLEKMEAGDPWATAQYEQMLMQHGYDVQDGIQDGVFPDLRTVLDSFCAAREFYDDHGGQDSFGVSFDEFFAKYDFSTVPVAPEKSEVGGYPDAAT